MKKFGFGKKSDGGSKEANPYAQQPAEDPYAAPMTPYQQARSGLPSGPRGGGGLPSGPRSGGFSNAPPPAYSEQNGVSSQQQQQPPPRQTPGGGYGNEKYGAAGGYGNNRYDNNAGGYGARPAPATGLQPGNSAAPRRAGGYGGLGGDDEDSKNQLFSGARERAAQRQAEWGANGDPASGRMGASGASSASGAGGSYGGYGEARERTAEEQEEDEVQDMKSQINAVRDDSIQSLQRSLQHANRAEETIRSTLARLGQQDEMLYNTEKNLDLAANQNRIAADRTKELKTLNGSMFAVHVSNPFTKNQRKAQRDADVLDRHRMERDTREATRRGQFSANAEMEKTFRDMDNAPRQLGLQKRDASERSKFTFEDDDGEQEEKERQIDEYEDQLGHAVSRLRFGATAAGEIIGRQTQHIDRINTKSDRVDDDVRMVRDKMARIK